MAGDLEGKPPICGKNVPKWPGMSLFEPGKKSSKRIVNSKIPLNSFRKNPPICAKNVPKRRRLLLFEPKKSERIASIKIPL